MQEERHTVSSFDRMVPYAPNNFVIFQVTIYFYSRHGIKYSTGPISSDGNHSTFIMYGLFYWVKFSEDDSVPFLYIS